MFLDRRMKRANSAMEFVRLRRRRAVSARGEGPRYCSRSMVLALDFW